MTPPVRSVRLLLASPLALALLGGAGWLGLSLLGPAAPAAAATAPCVGVVVDGRLAGGSLRTSCAAGDPRSGLEALTDAGFRYAFVPRQPGLVCQVDGLPACGRTSSETYWSYWYRANGSRRWVYASQGAGSHDPAPGSTEAWVWQDGGRRQPPDLAQAAICPQASRASSTPEPTTAAARKTSAPATAKAAPAKAAPASRPGTKRPSTPPPTPTPTPTAPTVTAVAAGRPAPPVQDGGGTPWVGPAVGLGAVALLGGAAVARSRRTGRSS